MNGIRWGKLRKGKNKVKAKTGRLIVRQVGLLCQLTDEMVVWSRGGWKRNKFVVPHPLCLPISLEFSSLPENTLLCPILSFVPFLI